MPANSKKFIPGSSSFYDIELNYTNGNQTYSSLIMTGTANVAHRLTLTDGWLVSGVFNVQGDVVVEDAFSGSSGNNNCVVLLTGSGTQTIQGANGILPGVEINSTGTVQLGSDINVSRSYKYTSAGAFIHNNHKITFITPDTGTLGPTFTPGDSINYYDMGFNYYYAGGYSTLIINGTLTLANNLTLTDGTLNGGTVKVAGGVTVGGSFSGGTSSILLNGTSTQAITCSGGTMVNTLNIVKTNGTATISGIGTFHNINVTNGTLDFAGGSTNIIIAGKTITVAPGKTLKFTGTGYSITNMVTLRSSSAGTHWHLNNASGSTVTPVYVDVKDSYASNTVIAANSVNSGGNDKWNFGSNITWWGTTSTNWDTGANWSSGSVPADSNIVVFSGAYNSNCTLAGSTTVAGFINGGGYTGTASTANYDLTVNGAFQWNKGTFVDAGSATLTICDNADFSGGTFMAETNSTVLLAGTNEVNVSGSPFFYNLTSATAGKVINFEAGNTNTVNGKLTLTGVTLNSTADGTYWYLTLDAGGSQRVRDVNVRDSNATNGQTILAYPFSKDNGHNVNWTFLPPAGTVFGIK